MSHDKKWKVVRTLLRIYGQIRKDPWPSVFKCDRLSDYKCGLFGRREDLNQFFTIFIFRKEIFQSLRTISYLTSYWLKHDITLLLFWHFFIFIALYVLRVVWVTGYVLMYYIYSSRRLLDSLREQRIWAH